MTTASTLVDRAGPYCGWLRDQAVAAAGGLVGGAVPSSWGQESFWRGACPSWGCPCTALEGYLLGMGSLGGVGGGVLARERERVRTGSQPSRLKESENGLCQHLLSLRRLPQILAPLAHALKFVNKSSPVT